MARYAIVHWEDHFVSLINLENVKEPRKPVQEYKEGNYITATYGKKPYRARISEISDDRAALKSKVKDGQVPLRYRYEKANFEENSEEVVASTMSPYEEEPTGSSEQEEEAASTKSSHEEEPTGSSEQEKVTAGRMSSHRDEPTGSSEHESTLERGTAARNKGNLEIPFQPTVNTPAAKRQSESGLNPTPPPSLDSKIRRLERKYKDLEREVARIKRKMESSIDQTSTMSSETTTPGLNLDELLNAVSHLSTSDLGVVLKTLVFKVFKMEEIMSCTRTGKKTANSGETPRPALDRAKQKLFKQW